MRLFSWIRLPSFKTACVMCVTSLALFAVWAFIDASFGAFWQYLWMDLGLTPGIARWARDDGPRRWLLGALVTAWTLPIGVVFYRVIAGSARDRSVLAMFVLVTLLATTVGSIVGATRLHAAGFGYRIARVLPYLKQDAAILEEDWPSQDGELPFFGSFLVDDLSQFSLSAWGNEGARESFHNIQWLENVGIAFESDTRRGTFVEKHLPGRTPITRRRTYGKDDKNFNQLTLVNYREIEPNWYIVEYEVEWFNDGVKESP